MDRRTRVLAIVIAAVGVAFVLDQLFLNPWMTEWNKLTEEIAKAEQSVQKSRDILAREKTIRVGWDKIKTILNRARTPDIQTHFISHMEQICGKVGVRADIQDSRDQRQGDFNEYVYETKFKLTWEKLVSLLVELHNSRELLKPLRIGVASQYEREELLDLDIRISTIEYEPLPAKPTR